MEIERKFLIKQLPFDPGHFPSHRIEQGYLNTEPVVRVRQEDDNYYLTYKGKGFLAREEYNLPLNKEAYEHLIAKADGNIITKRRYLIPLQKGYALDRMPEESAKNEAPATSKEKVPSVESLTIELDIFEGIFSGLILAEVEFPDIDTAKSFVPPRWFGEDVTEKREYSNSFLSRKQMNNKTV